MRKFLLYTAIILTFAAALLALFNFRRDKMLILKQATLIEDQRSEISDLELDMKELQEKYDTALANEEAAKKEVTEVKAPQKKGDDEQPSPEQQVGENGSENLSQKNETVSNKGDLVTPTPTPATSPAASPTPTAAVSPTSLESSDEKKSPEKKETPDSTPDAKGKEAKQSHLEGTILAVNSTWNFVVISLGEQNGISLNRTFLIKRGDQVIAKAKVTSVEPSTAVADLVLNKEDSKEAAKVAVQVGDVVVESKE